MPSPWQQVVMVNALALLDANAHDPSTDAASIIVQDCSPYRIGKIYVESTQDQIIRVQLYNSIGRTGQLVSASGILRATTFGSPFDIGVGSVTPAVEARNFSGYTDVMPTLLYVQVQALVIPTTGTITVTLMLSDIKSGFIV